MLMGNATSYNGLLLNFKNHSFKTPSPVDVYKHFRKTLSAARQAPKPKQYSPSTRKQKREIAS